MTTGRILAAVAAIFTAAVLVGTASAQYPTPQGSLVCTTTVNVDINTSTVSATLRDSTGNTVSGQTVTFRVTSGTGTLSSSTATTNASGVASVILTNGSNTAVSATYSGIECSAVAQVLGSTFRPPATGDAGLVGLGDGINKSLILGIDLVIMGLAGIGILVMRQRRLAAERSR